MVCLWEAQLVIFQNKNEKQILQFDWLLSPQKNSSTICTFIFVKVFLNTLWILWITPFTQQRSNNEKSKHLSNAYNMPGCTKCFTTICINWNLNTLLCVFVKMLRSSSSTLISYVTMLSPEKHCRFIPDTTLTRQVYQFPREY